MQRCHRLRHSWHGPQASAHWLAKWWEGLGKGVGRECLLAAGLYCLATRAMVAGLMRGSWAVPHTRQLCRTLKQLWQLVAIPIAPAFRSMFGFSPLQDHKQQQHYGSQFE